jgi:hypothetical protein
MELALAADMWIKEDEHLAAKAAEAERKFAMRQEGYAVSEADQYRRKASIGRARSAETTRRRAAERRANPSA